MLESIACRLAADGLTAVLFTSDPRAPSAPTASTRMPMSPLAHAVSRLDLRRIASSRDLEVALRTRNASLVVLIDRPTLLPAEDRRAAAELLQRSDVTLVTGWSPPEWSAVLQGRLDQRPHDQGRLDQERRHRFTGLVDADLITAAELAPDETARLLDLYRRIGEQGGAARDDSRSEGPPAASCPSQTRLTRREREIAEMIGDGLTDRQIAERLHLSTRTVESHVLHARGRIGAGTRSALAASVLRDRFDQE
ncbi:helix-turn-helix transcriptional regulator [Microcella daejeonensis]|uniref:Helix-turn-helix transcriptional regulator n=1 Tax=Microcella daejeonensis TaxID=2994971 RepID=A0A9E8MMA0_9MICO|nr:helix-turn-helix transcriptional regulator [Microcella daejeonensis]WAB82049.1 helix-turn-helix transcriptional regulator [Microcella daejeonensis]